MIVGGAAVAADGIETRPIHFAKGASSATVKGTIKGDQTVDYTVRARAGQTMSVKLTTRHGANYFNVLPPGSDDVAIFVGSSGGSEWSGALQADGEYKLRVYLMRWARRREAMRRSRARVTTPPGRCRARWATRRWDPRSANSASSAASRATPRSTSSPRAASSAC